MMPTQSFFQPVTSLDIPEPDSYSIHLMWINKTKNEAQPYICAEQSEADVTQRLLRPAIEWARANPDANVFIWYDSEHTTSAAVENTHTLLTQLMQGNQISNLKLRDVRDIPIVQNNPDAFSDLIPVYFRVDLLKCMILVDAIEREHQDSAIFSDLEIGDGRPAKDRMTKQELFAPEIMKLLNEAGLILGLNGPREENQFIQLINKKNMIEALKIVVINAGLMRLMHMLNTYGPRYLPQMAQSVFVSMGQSLPKYYTALEKQEAIGVYIKGSPIEPFSLDKHGYEPFGLLVNPSGYMQPTLRYPPGDITCATRNVDCIRGGNSHEGYDFVPRAPANGSDHYTCTLMALAEPSAAPSIAR